MAGFLFVGEDGENAVLAVQVIESNLFGDHHSHKEAKSSHEYPEGSSEVNLHFHENQSKQIEGDPHEIVADGHNVAQIVLLALSLPRPPHEVPHHPVDVVRLHYRPQQQQQEGQRADDQQFLENGLAVEVGGQAELIGELWVGLVVVKILLFAVEQIDVKGERALHD